MCWQELEDYMKYLKKTPDCGWRWLFVILFICEALKGREHIKVRCSNCLRIYTKLGGYSHDATIENVMQTKIIKQWKKFLQIYD